MVDLSAFKKAAREDAPKAAGAAPNPAAHAQSARADEKFESAESLKKRLPADVVELIMDGPPTATGKGGQPLGRGGIDYKVTMAMVRAGFTDKEIENAYLLGRISHDAVEWPRGFRGELERIIARVRAEIGTVVSETDHMARAADVVKNIRPHLKHYRGDFHDHQDGRYVIVAQPTIRADVYKYLDRCKKQVKRGKLLTVEPFQPNIKSVAETMHAIEAATHLPPENTQPMWLDSRTSPDPAALVCFPNGMLNLDTDDFMPPDPALFTSSAARFAYDKDAPEPVNFLAFLNEAFAGEQDQIDSLQEWFGYCLSPDVSQEKAGLLVGDKRSGKDTTRHCLEAILPEGALCGPTLDSLGTNFGMSQLIGKQAAIIGDCRIGSNCDKDLLAENVLKLTGRGLFTIDRKFQSHWTGTLPCKLLAISNERPAFKDTSGALASRFIVWRTRTSFYGREDPDLFRDKLKPELPGILLWALDGLRRMRKNGKLAEPACSIAERQQLAREGSPVLAFVQECLTLDPKDEAPKDAVYAVYNTWAAANGLGQFSRSKAVFFRDLQSATGGKVVEHKVSRPDGTRERVLAGARLNATATAQGGEHDEQIPF